MYTRTSSDATTIPPVAHLHPRSPPDSIETAESSDAFSPPTRAPTCFTPLRQSQPRAAVSAGPSASSARNNTGARRRKTASGRAGHSSASFTGHRPPPPPPLPLPLPPPSRSQAEETSSGSSHPSIHFPTRRSVRRPLISTLLLSTLHFKNSSLGWGDGSLVSPLPPQFSPSLPLPPRPVSISLSLSLSLARARARSPPRLLHRPSRFISRRPHSSSFPSRSSSWRQTFSSSSLG